MCVALTGWLTFVNSSDTCTMQVSITAENNVDSFLHVPVNCQGGLARISRESTPEVYNVSFVMSSIGRHPGAFFLETSSAFFLETSSAFFSGNLQRLFSSRPRTTKKKGTGSFQKKRRWRFPEKMALEVSRKKAPGCHPEAKFNWTSLIFSSGNLQRQFMDLDAGDP